MFTANRDIVQHGMPEKYGKYTAFPTFTVRSGQHCGPSRHTLRSGASLASCPSLRDSAVVR
ncbi:MAG: hypothetical protein KFH87_01160 [Bacteroidetes bacterium]|nr:hypothetical protein [Bacteroidota bacterium]